MLQDHLDQLLNLFDDAVCITDASATVLYLNNTYEKLTGIPYATMIGQNVRELSQNGLFDLVLNPEVIATGKHVSRVQTLRDGTKLVLDGYPIFDFEHRPAFCVTLIRDSGRLKELEGRVQFQKELLDVFLKLSSSGNSTVDSVPEIVESQAIRRLHGQMGLIARTDAPVLLLGETGVGKEVLAHRIHNESGRAGSPFIKVDCGSIAPSLIETELFGYVGGTFSGANKNGKVGLIEAASTGTVFLDEIGELPLTMQTRLLRFLQDGEILRVGSTAPKRLNVRVIAATNKDLEKAVADGEFRSDLYYRLKIAVLQIPPLRERHDDILPMARFFLDFYCRKYERRMEFSPEAKKAMLEHDWPGNVRELKNMVQGLVVACSDNIIQPSDLPFLRTLSSWNSGGGTSAPEISFDGRNYKEIMKDMESAVLKAAMRKYGNIANVARELRVDRSTIFRKVKDLEKRGVRFD
ncbi:sigma 54-interacting transcriptional regulator [uncultured Mailhella sp.]|uniref:sigma-54 interaction domain-containing protein n=1 Tax=uncultured Mailhella sp. TaxID=1981031 RepID=UPI0026374992|nr:sigma 54-interacting transcriptional regulator [uncultured Mailhella sp.]